MHNYTIPSLKLRVFLKIFTLKPKAISLLSSNKIKTSRVKLYYPCHQLTYYSKIINNQHKKAYSRNPFFISRSNLPSSKNPNKV